MNLKKIEKQLIAAEIESNEAKIEAKMLVRHFLGFSDVDLILKEEFDETKELKEAIQIRIDKRLPIQYITGIAHFMGEEFVVNESVLIPRDETELLVRKAIETINCNDLKAVLDIGTGSGCIACMIAKNTDAQVIGVDVSMDALQVALDNTSRMKLFNRAIFRKSDVYSKIREKFDLIVSNPPYIPPMQKENIQVEVKFEPEGALYTSDDKGVEFYEKIIRGAKDFLNPKGYLMFELGINQSELVANLMIENGFKNIEIQKDLAYIDRVISGGFDD